MSTIKNDTFYEWVKGDHVGIIEKIASEVNENGIDWINFESGRRINKNFFEEFLLLSETGLSSIDPIPTQSSIPQPLAEVKPKVEKKTEESPISLLLKSQKKKIVIMHDSFGDDLITEIYKMNLNKLEETLPNKFEEAIKFHLKIK